LCNTYQQKKLDFCIIGVECSNLFTKANGKTIVNLVVEVFITASFKQDFSLRLKSSVNDKIQDVTKQCEAV